jgi:hypothetical protein
MEFLSTLHLTTTIFTLFPSLPEELQLKIWELSLEPRAISISSAAFSNMQHLIHGTYKIPAILHACTFSRELGLQHYQKLLVKPLLREIYVDRSRDTLQFLSIDALCMFTGNVYDEHQADNISGVRLQIHQIRWHDFRLLDPRQLLAAVSKDPGTLILQSPGTTKKEEELRKHIRLGHQCQRGFASNTTTNKFGRPPPIVLFMELDDIEKNFSD